MTRRKTNRVTVQTTIDQISPDAEGADLASLVTDDGRVMTVPLSLLPPEAATGDVIAIRFERDQDEAAARQTRVADLQKKLFGIGFEP